MLTTNYNTYFDCRVVTGKYENGTIPKVEDCDILEVTKSNNVAGAEGRADPYSTSSC